MIDKPGREYARFCYLHNVIGCDGVVSNMGLDVAIGWVAAALSGDGACARRTPLTAFC